MPRDRAASARARRLSPRARRGRLELGRRGGREGGAQQGPQRVAVAAVERPVVAQIGARQRHARRRARRQPLATRVPSASWARRSPSISSASARSRIAAASSGQSSATLPGSGSASRALSRRRSARSGRTTSACQLATAAWRGAQRAGVERPAAARLPAAQQHEIDVEAVAPLQLQAGRLDPRPAVERDRIVPERIGRPVHPRGSGRRAPEPPRRAAPDRGGSPDRSGSARRKYLEAPLGDEARAKPLARRTARPALDTGRRRCRSRRARRASARDRPPPPRAAPRSARAPRCRSGSAPLRARSATSLRLRDRELDALDRRERGREIDQARPGQHALVGDVAEALRADCASTAASTSSCGASETCPPSPGIGCQRSPTGSRPPTPSPVPGPITPIAWPGDRLAAADLPPLVGAQHRDRQRLGGEVVDHPQPLEAERLAGRLDRERPRASWSARPGRRSPASPRRTPPRSTLRSAEIGAHRLDRARIVGDPQLLLGARAAVRPGQREAGVGAADVGDQAGAWRWLRSLPTSSPKAMPRPRAVCTRASSGSTA